MIDALTTAVNLLGTYLSTNQKSATWPVCLVGASLSTLMYLQHHLYLNVTKGSIELILLAYGWRQWHKQARQTDASVKRLHPSKLLLIIILLVGCITILSSQPFFAVQWLDTLTASLTMCGIILMALRYIECWLCFIIADVYYILLFLSHQLPFNAIKSCIYLILAIRGINNWRNTIPQNS